MLFCIVSIILVFFYLVGQAFYFYEITKTQETEITLLRMALDERTMKDSTRLVSEGDSNFGIRY